MARRDLVVTAADGTRLLVDHHPPRPAPDIRAGTVLWIRTPYTRRGAASFVRRFTRLGAHVLVEALRGTDGSGGEFDGITVNPTDGHDVATWLRAQDWFPGTIVTWGMSYPGIAQWALAAAEVPEWRLAILHDAPSEARSVIHPGGVFAGAMLGLVHTMDWQARHPTGSTLRNLAAEIRNARRTARVLSRVPLGTADRRLVGHRSEFFQEWLAHSDDPDYWQRRDLRRGVGRMPAQVHLTTGWHDTCLRSTLADYAAARDAGKAVRLVVGPWTHGGAFFDRAHTRETDALVRAVARGAEAVEHSVRVHVGGTRQWRDLPDWPPPDAGSTAYHLQPDGGLAVTPAPVSEPDRYRYDPADPTPNVGGAGEIWTGNAGARDNRKLERRADVLTYTTPVLDADVEVIGEVTARIVMRSSLGHTDLFVRLCDVDPKGRSINVCDGIQRLRPDDPPVDADGSRAVHVDLAGAAHRFQPGHRIRVQVSSGAHPRLVRNTGCGEPLATAVRLCASDQEIFHDPEHVSTVTLPVVGGAAPGPHRGAAGRAAVSPRPGAPPR